MRRRGRSGAPWYEAPGKGSFVKAYIDFQRFSDVLYHSLFVIKTCPECAKESLFGEWPSISVPWPEISMADSAATESRYPLCSTISFIHNSTTNIIKPQTSKTKSKLKNVQL